MKFRLHSTVASLIVLFGCVFGAQATPFEPLFKITSVKGAVMILRPGTDVPERALEAHVYPYCSRIILPSWNPKSKAVEPEVNFSLSRDHRFRLSGSADLELGSNFDEGLPTKTFTLKYGKLKTFISVTTVKTGGAEDEAVEVGMKALTVVTPLATCTRLTERNEISVSSKGDTHTVMFVTESGTMEVEGPQFKINSMRRNAAIEIFGDVDYTRILNLASDFTVELEKGADAIEKVLFRPRSVAKIWRSYAEIGGKQAVSVMVAFPDGSITSYAYMQGEKAATDSTFASQEKDLVEDELGDSFPEDGDVLEVTPPAVTGLEPSDSTEKPKPAAEDLGGFNFDDW